MKGLKALVLATTPLWVSFSPSSALASPDFDWVPPSINQCANSSDPKLQKICLDVLVQLKKSQLERELDLECLYEEESNQFLGSPISEECKERLAALKKRQADSPSH